MPSTARFVAVTDAKVHAHLPDSDDTLCGLIVLESDRKRFYNGVNRPVCQSCLKRRTILIRQVGAGMVGSPMQAIRGL